MNDHKKDQFMTVDSLSIHQQGLAPRKRMWYAELFFEPNMTKSKALPWSKSDEEAVELRSVTPVMAAKILSGFFIGPSGERFHKNRKE